MFAPQAQIVSGRSGSRSSTHEVGMDFAPSGNGRLLVALAVIGLLAILVWGTMEPGKWQQLTWVLLGFFAFRVLLGRAKKDSRF